MLELSLKIKSYALRNLGFALFLAWNYTALYGYAMSVGAFVPYNLEYIWIVAGAVELLCALVGLSLVRRRSVLNRRAWGVAAAGCAVAGNIALWLSYIGSELYGATFVVAGIFIGVGVAFMMAVWGSRLASCNYSKIEFDVLASFLLAFALYSIAMLLKLNGTVNMVVASVLPVVSMVLAFRKPLEGYSDAECPVDTSRSILRELRRSASTFVMITLLWFLIAYLRVVLAPLESYDRLQLCLFPYFIALITSVVLFVVLIKVVRYLSVTLAYRWALPFMLLGLGVWYYNPDNLANQIVAYSLNSMGMFGVQISCWIAVAKYLHRRGESSLAVLFGFAGSEGLGVLLGCGVGLIAVAYLDVAALAAASLIVMAGSVFAIMLVGFNPYWRLDIRNRRAPGYELSGESTQERASDSLSGEGVASGRDADDDSRFPLGSEGDYLTEALRRQAALMQSDYGLTDRETEIMELLLAGRSRPYIRDKLFISLNTVHSHASNIFTKCGVHSQQELIDLMHP